MLEAGLWKRWTNKLIGQVIDSFTILTCEAGPAAEMNSPSVEASGRWAALLIRLASRSRHRRDSGHVQTLPQRGGI